LALFVINEWLWHDSRGENGKVHQKRALLAMTSLAESDHQIIIIEGSSFDKKAWALCRSQETVVAALAKIYVTTLRQNLDRCKLLKPDDVTALPEELISSPKLKDDDRYLVQAQQAVPGAIIVTTDGPLRELLTERGLRCLSREEFFANYCRC
jgi:hypothetical protein